MKKHFLMLTLCVLLALASVFTLSSCRDDSDKTPAHTHTYKDTVTSPTCTAGGYTTHTCSCGHSYTDTETPVAPHATTTKILRYPTTLVKGRQVVSCSNCSYSVEEEINVVTSFTMPGVAEALASMLPQGSFVIDDCDSLPTISISKFRSKEFPENTLLSPLFSRASSRLALQLHNVAVSVENGNVTGTLVFDVLDYVEEGSDTPTPIFSFAFYLANEDVSISIDNATPTNFKLSDKIYETLASTMDMTVEELKETWYLTNEAKNYLPLVESIANALAGELAKLEEIDVSGVMSILSLISEDIVQAEVVGENTVYTVKLGAAIEALSTYENKTIANILDDSFGAGTAASLKDFLTKLPDMTIGDIADAVITLSETYSIDLDQIYAIINGVVYNATDAEFDFESELYEQYDKTLLSVLTDGSAQTAEQIKTALINAADALTTFTVSDLVHLTSCDPEDDHSMEDCVLLSTALDSITAVLNEALTAEVTVDAEGNIVALDAALTPFLTVSKTANDIFTVTLALPEYPAAIFMLDLSLESRMEATLTVGDVEFISATFAPGEGNCMWVADLTVKLPQTQLDSEVSYTTLSYTLRAEVDNNTGNITLTLVGNEANATIILDENGNVLTFDIALPFLAATKTEDAITTVTLSLPDRPVIGVTVDLSKAEEKTATLTVDGLERAKLLFIPGENSRSFITQLSLKVPTPAQGGAEGETVLKDYIIGFSAQCEPEDNSYNYILQTLIDDQMTSLGVAITPNELLVECARGEDFDFSLRLAKNPDAPEITLQAVRNSQGEERFDNFDFKLFLAKTANGFVVTLTDNLNNAELFEILSVNDAEAGNASLSISSDMINFALTKTTENDVITYALVNTATETTLVSAAVGAGALDFTFGFADHLTGGISLRSSQSNGSLQFSVECKDLTIVSTQNYTEPFELNQTSPSDMQLYYEVTQINTYMLDGILSFTLTPAAN